MKEVKILELKKKRIDRLINLVNDKLDGKSNRSFEVFFSHFFSEHTERATLPQSADGRLTMANKVVCPIPPEFKPQ